MDSKISRVLIVDDMTINRLVLSSVLGAHGIISDQAESGFECIEHCEENDYDLILLDHRMPDMDGVETLVKLKELFKEKGTDTPVICHTTEDGRQNTSLYKAAGFSDVIIKPVDPAELYEVIKKYIPDLASNDDEADNGDNALGITDEEEETEEVEKLPMWLKIVPHIDLVLGVENCGSAEDYMESLYIFHSSIEENADDILSYLEDENWTMYTLRVHSLKSMARLIGAKKLADIAAALESASRNGDYKTVQSETRPFLDIYRELYTLLSPIDEENEVQSLKTIKEDPLAELARVKAAPDHSHDVLFIHGQSDIVTKGIENNLDSIGFRVINVPDEPDRVIAHRSEADIIIYLPGQSDNLHVSILMNLLGETCQDDNKILCLIGDMADIRTAMHCHGSHRVSRTYSRPVKIYDFLKDMEYFATLQQEYHRRKTVYIVDDDSVYLPIIEHWLSEDYNSSGFSGAKDALGGISAITPDLMLLDYEMPEMNGFELMRKIRSDFPEVKIPIIFLTGKNDKEHVFRILEDKPDGYILKSSTKSNILDVIHRFFAEKMFRLSQRGYIPDPDEN